MNKSHTILIVDDEHINITYISEILQDDYNIKTANDARTALKIISKYSIDLLLLDIVMPEMNGFEMAQRIRAYTPTENLPIIFLTALSEKEDVLKGYSLGAEDYIIKPYDADILKAKIHTHIVLNDKRKLIENNYEIKTHEYIASKESLETYKEELTIQNEELMEKSQLTEKLVKESNTLFNNLPYTSMVIYKSQKVEQANEKAFELFLTPYLFENNKSFLIKNISSPLSQWLSALSEVSVTPRTTKIKLKDKLNNVRRYNATYYTHPTYKELIVVTFIDIEEEMLLREKLEKKIEELTV